MVVSLLVDVVLYSPNGWKVQTENLQLPFGLMAISSCLKQAGFSAKIVNEVNLKDNIKEVINSISDETLFLGITTCSGTTIYDALIVCSEVRKHFPDLPLVWGGVHPTTTFLQTIQHPLVDIIVRGPGEETTVNLAKALKKNIWKSKRHILLGTRGLTYKSGNDIISTADADFPDIDNFPMLDYGALDIEKYIVKTDPDKLGYDDIGTRNLGYATSRGCPHRCGFCSISAFCHRKWQPYPAERVVRELKHLVNTYNVNGFVFNDDNFFVSRKRVEEICDLLIKENLNIKWAANCRVDYFSRYDDDFINKLKESGCQQIFFGGESGSQRILDFMKKDITTEQVLDAVKKCKKHNLTAKLFYMMGFPTETMEDLYETIDIIDEIHTIFPESLQPILIYTPYERTPLMEESKKHGLIPPQTLEEWGEYNFLKYDLPWGDNKYKSTVKTVSIISHFLLGYQRSDRFSSSWQRVFFSILKKNARFRWENKMFGFAPEWGLVRWYLNKELEKNQKEWVNYVKKTLKSQKKSKAN